MQKKTEKLISVRLSIALFAIMILAPVYFLTEIKFNNLPEIFSPPNSEINLIQKSIRQSFPEDNVLIVLFTGEDLYSDSFILKIEKTVSALNKSSKIEHVMGLSSNDYIIGSDDGFQVEKLLGMKEVKALSIKQRVKRIIEDRFAPGRIVSREGDYTALIIRPHPLADSMDATSILNNTKKLIEQFELSKNLQGFAGNIMVEDSMFNLTVEDNSKFIPVTMAIGFVLLWFMFRRKLPIVLSLLTIGAASNMSLLYLVVTDTPYSMPVAMVMPLIIALSMAFMVHLLNARLEAQKTNGDEATKMCSAINEVKRPIFFTMLTTVLGLLSLNFSPVPPIQTFGISAAIGVFLLYFITVYLQPPLIAKWSGGNWKSNQSGVMWIDHGIRKLAQFGIRNAGLVFCIMLVIIVTGVYSGLRVKAETDFLLYFPEDHEVILATNKVEKELAGTSPLEIIFSAKGRDALKDPKKLSAIKKIQYWLEARDEVDLTISMPDIIEEFNWAFNGEDPAFRILPTDEKLVSQYLFIYDGKDLFDMVDYEFEQTRLLMNLNIHGTSKLNMFIAELTGYLEKNVPSTMQWQIGGIARVQADMVNSIISGQLYSGFGAIALIFLVMLLLWRSVPGALLCLLPNIAPLVFIFAVMGALGITLDIGTAIISSIALGIAVDDTIHIYDGYHKRIKNGVRPIVALVKSYRINGRAISVTTVILCTQYFVLATSDFIPTYQFGLMTGIGLIAALFFDIILLPALLAIKLNLVKRREPEIRSFSTEKSFAESNEK